MNTAVKSSFSDFEVCFLGTGTSHGIPVIACDCNVCQSSDPRDKRLRSSIYIQTPECAFLVDSTPDLRQQCLRENIRRIDAVIYTHAHTDHILGFDDLRRFCEIEGKRMPIYASESTMTDLRRVFAFAFGEVKWPNYMRPEPHLIEGPFLLGETEITPIRLPHGSIAMNGYLFCRHGKKLLAYMTDCSEVPDEAIEKIYDCEVLVVDALRFYPHSTHMTIEQAIEVAHRVRAKKTYFIHMCHDLAHEETEKKLPKNIFLSYDRLRIPIDV